MPRTLKWGLVASVAAVCVAAAYIMIARGPAVLLDLSSAVIACF